MGGFEYICGKYIGMNSYSEQEKTKIFDSICQIIVDGKSLRTALKEVDLPAKTFFVWLREDDVKSKQYARATEERAELMFEDMFEIADDSTNDYVETENGKALNSEHIQRSRLRVDTRKWALSKLMPKKYGDKIDVTSDGEKINTIDPFSQIRQNVGINNETKESD